jgi:phenylpropionate dioxygenase-like ring-hydroxylating dioxygenase large terminal subunit
MSKRYPMPIPYGWFHVSYSNELETGQAKPIRYFGQDMVLYRSEDGEVACLDAYCPHMGAHLGYGIHELSGKGGEVKGGDIVCPFHGWKFNSDGFCTDVPYAKNIPPKVKDKQCLRSYPVVEENQCIWVWYHPDEKQEPMWQVRKLDEAQLDNDEWGEIENHRYFIGTHIQEIAENGADPAHFRYVHGTAHIPDVGEAVFEGHERNVVLTSKLDTPRGQVDGRIAFFGTGPGQAVTTFGGICDTVLLGHVTPIDEENIEVNFGFIQKKVNGEVPKGGVNAAIKADIIQQLEEDRPIWQHKVYRPNPILCDGDGPIAKFRKWYSQFYVDYEEEKAC